MIKSAMVIFSILSFSALAVAQLDGGGDSGGGGGRGTLSDFPDSGSKFDRLDEVDRYLNEARDKTIKARPRFAMLFDQAQNAILKNDIKKAEKLIVKLREIKDLNEYEQARLHLIDYWYYGKQGNTALENESAAKLLSVGAGNIDSRALVQAGMRLLKYQYNNQDIGGAIETLTNLRKESDAQSELQSVTSAVKKLDDYAAQKTNIVQKISVNEKGSWSIKLFKPHFLFSGISGEINTLEFNCANKQSTLPYKPDSVMEIPDAWGSCAMKVNAKPNTTFNFIQLQQKPT